MKKKILLLAAVGIIFTACEGGLDIEDNGGTPSTPKIELSQPNIEVGFEPAQHSISVTSPHSWEAISKNDWIVIDTKSGIGGTKELKFSVERNEELEIREGTIVVKNEDYNLVAELYITQKAFVPAITIETETLTFAVEGGTQEIAITANFEYEYSTNVDWITIEKSENGISATAPNYVEVDERTAEITISSEKYGISKVVKATQGAFVPAITIEPESLIFAAKGGTQEIAITANFEYEFSTNADWLAIEKSGNGINVTAIPNSAFERTAEITISNEEYGVSKVIKAIQDNEFAIEVTNIGEYGATIKVTPKDMERTYFQGVWDYVAMVELGGLAGLMKEAYELYKGRVEQGKDSWLSGPYPLLKSGVSERTLTSLSPGTKYVAMVFGVDANGNLTSTAPSYTEFITLDSTFDTSVWPGIWNVTTDYVFVEKVANQQYVSGVQSAEGFSRNIEIIDAELVFGSEYAGYAAILGWEALFPELQADVEGLEDTTPILGTYVGNTIELSNEFMIGHGSYSDTGDPYYIMWYAQWLTESENLYIVPGNYAPYTFKMGNDGNVTIEAYSGSLGDEDGTVVRLSIWLEDSEGAVPYYVYTDLAQEEETVRHFSGETMTAAKVDAGATPAPAKLSAKKGANNFRAVHKMAHPTTSAIEFSTAVRTVKFGKLAK